jgi:hypothetical protein
MKKYIYYPNLEPPDDIWMKFSLLYLDKIECIVPYNRQHLLSYNFTRIKEETDLVDLFSPEYNQGERASIRAMDEAQSFLAEPYRKSFLFNRVNLFREWKDPRSWKYTIFEEKFSNEWADFCTNNNIGRRTQDGLILPIELAFIFMTHLAKEISHDRNGAIITDNNKFDNYTNYTRVFRPEDRVRNKFAKGIVSLLVPNNLDDIDLGALIKFRKANRKLIRAFNKQIDLVSDSIGNGLTEGKFIENFNNLYSNLTREILIQGIGIASIPFAAYILIKNPQALTPEYIKEILGGMGLALGGTFAVKKAMFDINDKRLCKKYLTNLSRFK